MRQYWQNQACLAGSWFLLKQGVLVFCCLEWQLLSVPLIKVQFTCNKIHFSLSVELLLPCVFTTTKIKIKSTSITLKSPLIFCSHSSQPCFTLNKIHALTQLPCYYLFKLCPETASISLTLIQPAPCITPGMYQINTCWMNEWTNQLTNSPWCSPPFLKLPNSNCFPALISLVCTLPPHCWTTSVYQVSNTFAHNGTPLSIWFSLPRRDLPTTLKVIVSHSVLGYTVSKGKTKIRKQGNQSQR